MVADMEPQEQNSAVSECFIQDSTKGLLDSIGTTENRIAKGEAISAANKPKMHFHMSITPLTINHLSTADSGTPTPSQFCSALIQGRRTTITVPLDDERWRRKRVGIATTREHENDNDVIKSEDMISFARNVTNGEKNFPLPFGHHISGWAFENPSSKVPKTLSHTVPRHRGSNH